MTLAVLPFLSRTTSSSPEDTTGGTTAFSAAGLSSGLWTRYLTILRSILVLIAAIPRWGNVLRRSLRARTSRNSLPSRQQKETQHRTTHHRTRSPHHPSPRLRCRLRE